jgi:hypothetical protein
MLINTTINMRCPESGIVFLGVGGADEVADPTTLKILGSLRPRETRSEVFERVFVRQRAIEAGSSAVARRIF